MQSFKTKKLGSHETWGFLVILMSFVGALILTILPLPLWLNTLWPLWVVLILIFWASYLSEVINPWLVWVVGLFYDVLQGSFLGEHAIALLIVYLLARGMSRQIKSYPLWSQMSKIGLILIVYQVLMLLFQGGHITSLNDILLWVLPILTTLIIWPWMLFMLHGIAIRFYIHKV